VPIEGEQSGFFRGFSMIYPFKIPTSLQIMGDEYIDDNESVTTMLHLHLEYFTIID
jgi:hypothetical protein